ncbi:MAG: Ig domain-containing protein [Ruminococcus sp.]|nr:Ig domain-containing protein [Ruminococcus sp.]
MEHNGSLAVNPGNLSGFTYVYRGGCDISVTDVNATSVTFTQPTTDWGALVQLKTFKIYYDGTDVSGINLNKTSTTLTIGDSETLQATVLPDDAFYKTVTWSSDNEEVATVDENGKVTAVKAGTATITATATNGTDTEDDDKTATCEVTVNKLDSTVTEAPTANELTYNGSGQDLVTAGKAEGGTLVYAIGESADTAPEADAFSENIPGGKDIGTYYVWYKVIGDANHNDTEPVCVEVSIVDNRIDISEGTVTVDTENKTVTVKADGETVPESEYHVIYFTYEEIEGGETLTRVGTDFPTEPGTYIAGIVANEDSTLYIGENRSEPFTIEAPEDESSEEESKPESTPAPAPVDQNQGANPATGAAAGMGLAALAAAAVVVVKKKSK